MRKKLFLLLLLPVLAMADGAAGPAAEGLVRLADVDDSLVFDLRYATTDNFSRRQVYPHAVAVLRQETAAKLAAANQEFRTRGYRLKVWDAYRPPSVQEIFWQLVPDERYVAHPASGSRHSLGGAVDVTLVDEKGFELAMPTAFDDFSGKAAWGSREWSTEAAANAAYLAEVMVRHGFRTIDSEWWHFEDAGAAAFALIDVPFDRFALPPAALAGLDPATDQAIVVLSRGAGSTAAAVYLWEKGPAGWRQAADRLSAVIGRSGLARPGDKREGDGKTPWGIFALGTAFGYGATIGSPMPYRQLGDEDYWVDDPASPDYNRLVSGRPAAASFERMRRADDQYKYGLVIEYNTQPVTPGLGSAIFLHVWRGEGLPTAGCVALAEADVVRLLAWLSPQRRPVIILTDSPDGRP